MKLPMSENGSRVSFAGLLAEVHRQLFGSPFSQLVLGAKLSDLQLSDGLLMLYR